jgi:hypothetical protein
MKNKTFTVSTATLNAAVDKANEVILDVEKSYDPPLGQGINDQVTTKKLYPKGMKIYNTSGTDIEFNLIANEAELAEYDDDQIHFDKVLIQNGETLQFTNNLPRCYKFLLRKIVGGTATANLRIDFWNYN